MINIKKYAYTSDIKPEINGIYITRKDDKIIQVATNAFTLIETEVSDILKHIINTYFTNHNIDKCLLDIDTYDKLVKEVNKTKSDISKIALLFEMAVNIKSKINKDLHYPDYSQILNREYYPCEVFDYTINCDSLAVLLDTLNQVAKTKGGNKYGSIDFGNFKVHKCTLYYQINDDIKILITYNNK